MNHSIEIGLIDIRDSFALLGVSRMKLEKYVLSRLQGACLIFFITGRPRPGPEAQVR